MVYRYSLKGCFLWDLGHVFHRKSEGRFIREGEVAFIRRDMVSSLFNLEILYSLGMPAPAFPC